LELENYDEDIKERVLYALYYGPYGLKTNDFSSAEIHKDDSTEEVMNVDPTGAMSMSRTHENMYYFQ